MRWNVHDFRRRKNARLSSLENGTAPPDALKSVSIVSATDDVVRGQGGVATGTAFVGSLSVKQIAGLAAVAVGGTMIIRENADKDVSCPAIRCCHCTDRLAQSA